VEKDIPEKKDHDLDEKRKTVKKEIKISDETVGFEVVPGGREPRPPGKARWEKAGKKNICQLGGAKGSDFQQRLRKSIKRTQFLWGCFPNLEKGQPGPMGGRGTRKGPFAESNKRNGWFEESIRKARVQGNAQRNNLGGNDRSREHYSEMSRKTTRAWSVRQKGGLSGSKIWWGKSARERRQGGLKGVCRPRET